MGTSNFGKKNASAYFAFGMEAEDSFDYDMEKESVLHSLENSGFDVNFGRTYEGDTIASKTKQVDFGDGSFYLTVNVILRTGYYQGANLDWDFFIEHDCGNNTDYEYFDHDFVIECLQDFHYNAGMIKIHSSQLTFTIQNAIDDLVEET